MVLSWVKKESDKYSAYLTDSFKYLLSAWPETRVWAKNCPYTRSKKVWNRSVLLYMKPDL